MTSTGLCEMLGKGIISDLARTLNVPNPTSEKFARVLDSKDVLASYRNRFHIPKASHSDNAPEALYFAGNSLGPLPRSTRGILEEELKKWELTAVEGHFTGKRPWAQIDEHVTQLSAKIVGALPSEIAVMNSLSVNLHLMMVSFYRPTSKRFKIMIEDNAFCSDQHVVASQVQLHGFDPKTALVRVAPRMGEHNINTQDIIDLIEKEGDSIALIMLGAVQFYSGQYFDLERITKAGHAKGCYVAFDCAHAAGNVPLRLHDWGVDWACWCTYKYLNAGPGAIAGAFVHDKHSSKSNQELPRFCGWWGQTLESRFKMSGEWKMKPGAQSYMLSNPSVFSTLCLEAALEIHAEAGMEALRSKSIKLTSYLEYLLVETIPAKEFSILTPSDPAQRGCQLSLLLSRPVRPVNEELARKGVICDVREPNVLRVSPTPLFNSFYDVWKFVQLLRETLASPVAKL